MIRRVIAVLMIAAFGGAIVVGAWSVIYRRHTGNFFAMGGIPVHVVAYGRSPWKFKEDLRIAESQVDWLEDVFNKYRDRSELSHLNSVGKGCLNNASATLAKLLRRAQEWHEISSGAFDVTVGPLIRLWKEAEKKDELPSSRDIDEAKESIGSNHMDVDGKKICLNKEGVEVDLGAIAKGAILDHVAKVLEQRGVERGVIEAGGDVVAFGPGGFNLGIYDPFGESGDGILGVIAVPRSGVVTSGDYERYVTIGGKKYSHIIDPRSGKPVSSLISVTVIGPNATDADALATTISVLGREEGMALLKKLPAFKAVLIEKEDNGSHSIWVSRQLTSFVQLNDPWKGNVHVF